MFHITKKINIAMYGDPQNFNKKKTSSSLDKRTKYMPRSQQKKYKWSFNR